MRVGLPCCVHRGELRRGRANSSARAGCLCQPLRRMHGTSGNGGELGPTIVMRVPARTDEELSTVIRQGLPTAGMPAFASLTDGDVRSLITFLRTLKPREGSDPLAQR